MRDMNREIYVLLIRLPAIEKAGFSLPVPIQTEETFPLLGPQKQMSHLLHFSKQVRIFSSIAHEREKLDGKVRF